ncbi:MAG: ATP-dependent DNA ligase [Candidatus Eisenbacteria bacterium]|nr:ATP-dependent DNA ligase [Candidatus Latescibacterota bacterium]MBD3301705.1 ATP-dependent DNA ligase [Candidatus Eisenbacteria bacterium]
MSLRRYGSLTVEISREEKPLFPGEGITKGDLIDYYEAVYDRMRSHLEDRPLVLRRFPDGIEKSGFYQKQAAEHFPDWIRTTRVQKQNGHQDLVVCDKKATLAFLADQATIALHGWLSREDRPDNPDRLVVDLDPSKDGFAPVRRAALRCRELLDEIDVPSFVKTTGSRGLHVVVPLDRRADFDSVRAFARELAGILAERFPDDLTIEQRKRKRRGRIYVDVGRNAYAQTAVLPYSVRARPGAPVAVPLRWDEVERGRIEPDSFTIGNLFRRLARTEDPWRSFRRRRISVTKAARRLENRKEEQQS